MAHFFMHTLYRDYSLIGRLRDIQNGKNVQANAAFLSSVPLHFDHGLKSEYDQSNDLF